MKDDAVARTDPLLLEIIRNGLDTIADEMALILMRTAYSAIIRDSMDYSTAVCDAEGQIVGQGLTTPMHLGSFYDAMRHLITQYEGDIYEGDLFIGNDPYLATASGDNTAPEKQFMPRPERLMMNQQVEGVGNKPHFTTAARPQGREGSVGYGAESLANACSSTPPLCSRLALARSRSLSSVQPARAIPMIGMSSSPRRIIACSAGKIFL